MDREAGRRRLGALTAVVGAGAVVLAALVGATRPAPHHAAPTSTPTSDPTRDGLVPGDRRHDDGGSLRSAGGQPPDAGSSGS